MGFALFGVTLAEVNPVVRCGNAGLLSEKDESLEGILLTAEGTCSIGNLSVEKKGVHVTWIGEFFELFGRDPGGVDPARCRKRLSLDLESRHIFSVERERFVGGVDRLAKPKILQREVGRPRADIGGLRSQIPGSGEKIPGGPGVTCGVEHDRHSCKIGRPLLRVVEIGCGLCHLGRLERFGLSAKKQDAPIVKVSESEIRGIPQVSKQGSVFRRLAGQRHGVKAIAPIQSAPERRIIERSVIFGTCRRHLSPRRREHLPGGGIPENPSRARLVGRVRQSDWRNHSTIRCRRRAAGHAEESEEDETSKMGKTKKRHLNHARDAAAKNQNLCGNVARPARMSFSDCQHIMRKTLILFTAMGLFGINLNAEPLDVGAPAPALTAPDENGNPVDLAAVFEQGMTLVYFYPKADTPGCTAQACSLRDEIADLTTAGVTVLGVSNDSPEAQKKFKEKYNLPFTLLADSEGKVIEAFGVPTMVMGIAKRQSFLVKDGKIAWRSLNAQTATHAAEVSEAVAGLK